MNKVVVESFDRDLVDDIWSLKTDEIEIEQRLAKAAGIPAEITAYVALATSLLAFVTALLNYLQSRKPDNASNTKVVIYTSEHTVELENLVARHKNTVQIEFRETNDE